LDISSYIDHTILKPTTTLPDVEKVCGEALRYHFAAVCVPPLYVKKVKEKGKKEKKKPPARMEKKFLLPEKQLSFFNWPYIHLLFDV